MKNIISEINNSLESRRHPQHIRWSRGANDLENKITVSTQAEQQKERDSKKWGKSKGTLDNIKHNNIHIIEIPEKKREKERVSKGSRTCLKI